MQIFSLISFVAFLSHLVPAFAASNYLCHHVVLDGRHIQASLDYAYNYQMGQAVGEYGRNELFAIGTYPAREIKIQIKIGVTKNKKILYVRATSGDKEVKCRPTDLPATGYTEGPPST
ncbi:CSEP0471 putative effector protein [Blumeria hordei DH14]|uniref:CSEP0471 putative effector protein n=1 Tax=Blumeria graminis f. sp. hordei (strain DH14) TaxID=546991 RepID=N1JPR1_BLUG1|nr:CSEP0471 putative effector protein [Blumeria hordei DH14]